MPPGQRGWKEEYDQLSAADRSAPVAPSDLERLAIAAYLTGRDAESVDILARAHTAWLSRHNAPRAARSAFWAAFVLLNKNESARAGGWLARAQRVLDEGGHDCVERGYLLLPLALQHVARGELTAAAAVFEDAAAIGTRFSDSDLVNLARQGQGRTLLGLGEIARGVALLDEVMVAVTSGEVSPVIAGTVYCSVVSACFDLFDMRRAQEWTDALNRWCASQPDVVPYRGECLVHRAEIMTLHGAWAQATEEAHRACEWLSRPTGHPALGAARYQVAELHRLRGEFAEAEDAYRMASESGRTPHPGLALLRLAQGRRDAATAAISRVAEEARDRRTRSRVLAASVEILLAGDNAAAARRAADDLSSIARIADTPLLRAMSAHATGAVLLAEGDARGALASLRTACSIWHDLDVPYDAARAAVLIGLACRALGDTESAQMELDAARRTFAQLGAAVDVARVDELTRINGSDSAAQLTGREIEVLRLVASGRTNRSIADELAISEKTVARHLSNIFTKLDLPSRAAATAYAFRHRLV